MVRIGEDRTERLDVVPARYQVIVTIRAQIRLPQGPGGRVAGQGAGASP